jgi:hypothetical protein
MTESIPSRLSRDLRRFESRPDVHTEDGEGPVRELMLPAAI